MQLKEALSDIAEMRALLDRNQAYRGFRSIAIGLSALFVLIGGYCQLHYDLRINPSGYLDIWLCVAISSLIVTTIEMIVRGRISNDLGVWKMHGKVALSLTPSFVVGAIVTGVLVIQSRNDAVATENLWLLPGVWSLVYSLGLFAVCHLLHPTTRWAALYFLLTGCLYLILNWSQHNVEAWHMIAIFGVGQLLLAGILYWKVERRSG